MVAESASMPASDNAVPETAALGFSMIRVVQHDGGNWA
jgi:hypothetical protein